MGVNDLRQALRQHATVLVETSPLIYLLDNHPRYGELAAAVMELIELGTTHGVASVLALAEVLTRPMAKGNLKAAQDYEIYLTNFPNLAILPVDVTVAREAARLRGLHSLKLPDAIHLASAHLVRADAIVTNDKGWRGKTSVATVYVLEDWV